MNAPAENLKNPEAGYTLSVSKEDGFFHIRVEGAGEFLYLRELLDEVAALCRGSDCTKVICESAMSGFTGFGDIMALRSGLVTSTMPGGVKIALVCSPEYFLAYHYLGELVQMVSGSVTRVFQNLQEARHWLDRQ